MALKADSPRRASPLRAVIAVLWAFCGIRKGSERDKDLASIRPLHVIIAGVLMGALFILLITTVVRIVISN
ncbi:MAG: DUF2970 domain-containing protein [Burkholderiales bacterium]